MMKSLSIKQAWYGLILLVAFVPLILMISWGGLVFHNILFEDSIQKENIFREMLHRHIKNEINRLSTMLENKSDPMLYTLSHEQDELLLDELFKKVLSRETAIHALLLLRPDGEVIIGREIYDGERPDGLAIQQHANRNFSVKEDFMRVLHGRVYIGATELHPEGAFFTIAVPVGDAENPVAILCAEIDASILWRDVSKQLQREGITTYIINDKGSLLVAPASSLFVVGDDLHGIPLVGTINHGDKWPADESYSGINGKEVFGSYMYMADPGWYVITEIEDEYILQPIHALITKLIIVAAVIVFVFLVVGLGLVRRIVKTIQLMSADFERVGKQDFLPSSITSSFVEIRSMVAGFNNMVSEIAHNQEKLNQAAIVFDNTSEGIVITDPDTYIVSVNHAFTDITGYNIDEVIGKKISILQSGRHDSAFYKQMWQTIRETGRWHGEIENRRKNGEIYTELLSLNRFMDDSGQIAQYVGVFTDISGIKETEHKLEYLAHHDPLTGLPNRLLCNARLVHELQTARRNQQLVAVMFLDLDMFKNINDSLGHVFGDVLLKKVTSRMREHIRNKDTIARLGGDEFVLILGSLKFRSDAAHFAENVLELFTKPFIIGEHEMFIGASIGICIFPDDAEDADTILRNADTAMYRAKAEGRNNFQFYTTDLTSHVSERFSMENYLRHAVEKDELVIHYQPQYSLITNDLIAAEALLRWHHPLYGLIYPDRFISVLEDTGLIVQVGEWLIWSACRQLKQWENAGCPMLRMAINLSARQFWKPGFANVVQRIMDKTGIRPGQLDFEITESVIMRDTKITVDTLNEFHEMGVSLSVDDFGTGYSSLNYLKRFPINRLKIDKSFVRDIAIDEHDAEMINSIISLGHCMNLNVLAEGVETEEQIQYLSKVGCDEVQGYYYSHPLPADDFEKLCKQLDCK